MKKTRRNKASPPLRKFILAAAVTAAMSTPVFAQMQIPPTDPNDRFTSPNDIPKYREGDVVHTAEDYKRFLDLIQTATDARHAYEISRKEFGVFPLRFGRYEGERQIMIIGFRHETIRLFPGCFYRMFKVEYIDATEGKPGWLFVYPLGGQIRKDWWQGPLVQAGRALDVEGYCRQANKPLSYPRY